MNSSDAENKIILELSIKHYEKRVEVYPALYEVLSDFIKVLDFGRFSKDKWKNATKQDVIDFLLKLEAWDSKFAIFLTPHSTKVLYELRIQIHDLVKGNDEELQNMMAGNNSELRKCVSRLESSLKYDLGIFAV